MRRFELLLFVVNGLALLFAGRPTGRIGLVLGRILPLIALALLTLQIVLEGYRWQLIPIYMVSLFLAATVALYSSSLISVWAVMVGLGFDLVAVVLAILFPVFSLPEPTGPFRIGTVTLHLIDPHRTEHFSTHGGAPREVMAQIWYPADLTGTPTAYRIRGETTLKTEHLIHVKTHASYGIPVSDEVSKYPIIVYSGAWNGRRSHNLVQVEELVSHGFVVVGIDHPYGSASTVFPDGRVILANQGDFLQGETIEEVEKSYASLISQLKARTADVRFVLDELEWIIADGQAGVLAGRLDTKRVGIFGYSFGGAIAAEVCRTDPRIVAGVDLDGNIFGEALEHGIPKPFLFVSGAWSKPFSKSEQMPRLERDKCVTGDDLRNYIDHVDARRKLLSLEKFGGDRLVFVGATHVYFCDSPLYSPLVVRSAPTQMNPSRVREILNEYLAAFFAQHLNAPGKSSHESLNSRHPDKYFDSWPIRSTDDDCAVLDGSCEVAPAPDE